MDKRTLVSHCRHSKLVEQLTWLREDYPVHLRRAFDHYDHEPLLSLLMAMFQMAVHHVGIFSLGSILST